MSERKITQISRKIGFKLLAILLSIIIVLIVLPILTILFTPIYLFRLIISKSSKYLRPDLAKILTAQSTNLSFHELEKPTPAFMIIAVAIYDGTFSVESVRKIYVDRILPFKLPNGELRFPELKQYPVSWMGFRFWKRDENFDIKNHIKTYNLKSNSNENLIDLKQIEEEALARAFIKDQSPWDMIVINDYYPEKASEPHTVLLMRVHHCIGDGYSMIKLLVEGLYGKEKELPKKSEQPRLRKNKFISGLLFPIKAIYEFSEMLLNLIKTSPLHVLKEKRTKSNCAVTNKIPLERLKKLKDSMEVSLSSVLMSACAGGLKSMMTRKNIDVPDEILCCLPFPKPGHPDKLRNHLTQVYINLPLGCANTSEDRIKILNKSYKSLWKSTSVIINALLATATGGLISPLAKRMASGLVPSVLISNMPTNFTDLEIEGHRNIDAYFYSGLCNLPAVSFLIASFNGSVRIAVVTEVALMSLEETEQLVNYVEHELLSFIDNNEV